MRFKSNAIWPSVCWRRKSKSSIEKAEARKKSTIHSFHRDEQLLFCRGPFPWFSLPFISFLAFLLLFITFLLAPTHFPWTKANCSAMYHSDPQNLFHISTEVTKKAARSESWIKWPWTVRWNPFHTRSFRILPVSPIVGCEQSLNERMLVYVRNLAA